MLMNIIGLTQKIILFSCQGKYRYIIYFGIVIKEEVYIEVSSFITEKKVFIWKIVVS